MQPGKLYSSGTGRTFRILGLELRNNDPWVIYTNTQTLQEYSCRQEAFLSRFSPLPS